MATLTMPTSPGFTDTRFGIMANTRIFQSPISNTIQTVEAQGARWMATYSLPPMKRSQAAEWMAFLVQLRGRAGRFYGFDPKGKVPLGRAIAEIPLVKGDSQTGTSLITDGWSPSVANALKKGDYFSVNNELKMITENIDSDSGGNATLVFEPPLRASPTNNQAVTVESATCIMMLSDDKQSMWDESTFKLYGLSFSAEEVFQ